MKLSFVTPDAELADKGIEKPFGEPIDGLQAYLRIGYAGNDAFRNKLAKLSKNAQEQTAGRELPDGAFRKLQRRAMIGTILLGWRNWEEDDSTPEKRHWIEETNGNGKIHEANADRLLSIPLVFDYVNAVSGQLESFKKEDDAATSAAIKSGAEVEPAVGK